MAEIKGVFEYLLPWMESVSKENLLLFITVS